MPIINDKQASQLSEIGDEICSMLEQREISLLDALLIVSVLKINIERKISSTFKP